MSDGILPIASFHFVERVAGADGRVDLREGQHAVGRVDQRLEGRVAVEALLRGPVGGLLRLGLGRRERARLARAPGHQEQQAQH